MNSHETYDQPRSRWNMTRLAIGLFVVAVMTGLLTPIMPVCAWVSPALTLMFLDRMPRLNGFVLFFVSTVPLFVFQSRGVIPIPNEQLYVMAVMVGVIGFIPYWLQLAVKKRLPHLLVPLVFPAASVALEYAGSTGPFGTWGSLAYTQSGNLTIMQLASLFGIWGITFFVSWAASTAWWVCSLPKSSVPRISAEILAFITVMIAVIAFGQARIHGVRKTAAERGTPRQVACICAPQGTQPSESVAAWMNAARANTIGESTTDSAEMKNLLAASKSSVFQQLDYLLSKSAAYADAGAKLIVWSEAALITPPDFETEILARSRALAKSRSTNLALTLGVFRDITDDQYFENKTVLINERGIKVGEYFKTKTVPGEPSIVGRGDIPVFETASIGKVAPIICFDADFPGYVRQISAREDNQTGPDILIISANDWKEVTDSHANMSAFRAIENGVWVARATSNGKSAVISPLGEIFAQATSFGTVEPAMSGWVVGDAVTTIYSFVGDAFAWVSCVGLGLLLIRSHSVFS